MATRTDEKLEALAAHHEGIAQAIRTTISIMNGEDVKRAQAAFNGKISAAIKTSAPGVRLGRPPKNAAAANGNGHASNGNGHASKSKGGSVALATALKEHGKLTREALREKLTAAGQADAMRAIGAALRYGYIKKHGKGVGMTFEFKNMPNAVGA
jgi:hypothetical protein